MTHVKTKFAVAQLNPTIGDFSGNIQKILEAARSARDKKASMVIFPELSLTGYCPADLLEEFWFQESLNLAFKDLLRASKETPSLYWVVGTPYKNEGAGKPFYNSLVIIKDGKEVFVYHKQLLPTYGVFDEKRYFEPGPQGAPVFKMGNMRISFLICEDAWNDSLQDYDVNPLKSVHESKTDVLITINASPSHVGKRDFKLGMYQNLAQKYQMPILYCAQVGGHDQLVYDGGSFFVSKQGALVFELKRFSEDFITFDFDALYQSAELESPSQVSTSQWMPKYEFYFNQIVLGLKDYCRRCGFEKVVVGSSGGIDSALTLALAAFALGPEKVTAITMPSEYSSSGSVSDSQKLCENLGITLLNIPIKSLVDSFKESYSEGTSSPLKGVALENIQARIRGNILMAHSNSTGSLLLTTGNKSELSVGYCTLYGDTNGGIGLIGDLYKTEIFEFCEYLNQKFNREIIPQDIISKPPSAELAPGQKDQDSLPEYPVLDAVLKILLERNYLDEQELIASKQIWNSLLSQKQSATILKVKSLIAKSEYKRKQAPPVIKVRARAFGFGRQIPVSAIHFHDLANESLIKELT